MPASTIYPKGIQNPNATVGNGFLNFSYEIVYNYSDQTSSGDNTALYSYYLPADAVALTLLTNYDGGYADLFELSYQNQQLSFTYGEYYDISNGIMLDPAAVYSLIVGALGI